MGTKLLILILVSLLLVGSVSALKVVWEADVGEGEDATKCFDDGSFNIVLKANSGIDAYTNTMVVSTGDKTLKGIWDNDVLKLTSAQKMATFTGRENQLLEKKTYPIKINYKEGPPDAMVDAELTFDLECPGLSFSCERLGIKINDCTTSKRGDFNANLEIYGMEQSENAMLDPLKVVEYTLETQILYKDINGYTSKKGSLPLGATIKKTGDNKYSIEAQFDKYTTNHARNMWVKFNNMLPRTCSPIEYSDIILSHRQVCTYVETEGDFIADKQEAEQQPGLSLTPKKWEEMPPEELRNAVSQEISDLETKKSDIETRLNELYNKRTGLGNAEEESKSTTGYSIKESKSEAAKKSQLKILLLFLFITVTVGGSLLAYLYKEGYFY
ncbi:MAG: hypothetical protein Q8O03_04565 [Nanoarchaeota archaeon]|nr:hypothetical protein [Nanoarchaeota archaeon]